MPGLGWRCGVAEDESGQAEAGGGFNRRRLQRGVWIKAGFHLLLTVVCSSARHFLPKKPGSARQRISDRDRVGLSSPRRSSGSCPTHGSRRSQISVWCACSGRPRVAMRLVIKCRVHASLTPDRTPGVLAPTSPKIDEKSVCGHMPACCDRQPGRTLILSADMNYPGKYFETELAELDAAIMRPRREDEAGHRSRLTPSRQRSESNF